MRKFLKIIFVLFFLVFFPFLIQAQCVDPISPAEGESSVKIPVFFDWCSIEEAQSYKLRIYENGEYLSTQVFTVSRACIKGLKENSNYEWQIAGCSDEEGTDCESFGRRWTFATDGTATINPPDLYSPTDNADVSIPVTLDWSDVGNAQSYYIVIYKDSNVVRFFSATTSETTLGLCSLSKNTTYEWNVAACLNDDTTRCGDDCCDNEPGYDCAELSEKKTFKTTGEGVISPPNLINPTSTDAIPTVSLSDYLEWQGACGAESYRFEIKENGIIKLNEATSSTKISFNSLLNELDLGTTYSWYVKSCSDEQGIQCEENWSQAWQFKTTGGAPVLAYPGNNAIDVLIPTNFNWENVGGTVSYVYEVSKDDLFGEIVAQGDTSDLEVNIDYYPGEEYPGLAQNADHWWHVRSCIDEEGDYCGPWSSDYVFTTFRISAPCVFDGILDENCPSPEVGGSLYTYQNKISWQPVEGAKAYKYKIDYASKDPEEADENCVAGQAITEGVTTNTFINASLRCLGTYNWWLRSCIDEGCTETSLITPMLTFSYVQPVAPAKFGLVPCGRDVDNPETLWNEREDCGIKHIFILLKNIIDFVLWRVGLIALVFLVIFTAVVSYFSLGAPGTIINIKQIWQRAGTGYLIMFSAWVIVSIFVNLLGFTDKWWSLPF